MDEILQGETFEIDEEPVITPEQLQNIIADSGIKEMVDNIGKDFKEEAKQVVEDTFNDLDVALMDGLEDEEWDEDHALDQVMNDMVEDLEEESTEAPEPGLIIEKPERRRVKKSAPNQQREALKKGPLWDFRTNKSNDHLFED